MITGSLVIITDNNFENYLLTTVYLNPYVDRKINDKKTCLYQDIIEINE